jgi:hypothetical protein
MKEPFELEWMGGVAEHHFRRARPGADDLPWGTLDASKYPPSLVDAARGAWTEVAMNEYRAVASFAEVVRALTEARAPLDLVGMTGDFLADEARHVELASRVAMELGGATPREFDPDAFGLRADGRLSAFQRANELVLRVGCVAEAFAGGTAAGSLRVAAHPLTRAVLETILADEARHRRLGGLYFEWAGERLDDAERERLSRVLCDALAGHAPYWRRKTSEVREGVTREGVRVEDLHELGWLESARAVPLARKVVEEDVLAPLAKLGIAITADERQGLGLAS